MAPSSTASLARIGFRDPAGTLRELPDGWESDDRWVALLEGLGAGADADSGLRRLNRLGPDVVAGALEDPARARPLLVTLAFSDYLADVIHRTGGLAVELMGGPEAPTFDLRAFKDRRIVLIAAADLAAEPTRDSFEATGRALSELGDACVDRVLDGRSGLAVMAMGKYGGGELNYASDIDVLFVGREAGESEDALAREVMRVMNGPPTIFRADADLRPEGRDGPLVRSLEAYEAYYRRWAKVWEFQSLIKCRPGAGDRELGREFLELARPHVWPDKLAPDAVEQVRALKARAEAEIDRRGLGSRQVKLGRGGIRDVEFAVQLLQLVHGRHHPELRVTNTLEALDILGSEGFVTEEDAAGLAEAYVFLRHVEHRLQLVAGRQTHTLPTQDAQREHLARGLGFRDGPDGTALEVFEDAWRRTTTVVRSIHERLFYRPLLEAFGAAPAIGPTLEPDEALARLAALGFDRPPTAREAIAGLASGPSRRAKVMRAILPGLLAWLAEAPDPDSGLVHLADLAPELEPMPHLLAMLRDEPGSAEALCRALGTGPVLASLMKRDPSLVGSLQLEPTAGREDLVGEAVSIVSRAVDMPSAVSALRRWKDGHWLAIAVRELGDSSDRGVFVRGARELSQVADACLEAAVHLARAGQDARTGGPPPGGFAVVGMGRLGGEELSHSSDLDVMFVYETDGACPDGTEGRLYHSAVAESVVEILGSTPPIFRVDTELRPEGRSGPITRSLDGYLQYYERWAQTWEFQALLRARHAAGDPSVTAGLLDAVAPRLWPQELGASTIAEMRKMKARIERERVKARTDPRFDLKLGTGGLADVEFTVQLLQMRHGNAKPGLRTPNTLRAVDVAEAEGIIGVTDAGWLRDDYLLLNRVRNHLFLLRGLPTDVLPARDEVLERVARSLGYGRLSRSRFREEYLRTTRRARQVCDRLFYGEGVSPDEGL